MATSGTLTQERTPEPQGHSPHSAPAAAPGPQACAQLSTRLHLGEASCLSSQKAPPRLLGPPGPGAFWLQTSSELPHAGCIRSHTPRASRVPQAREPAAAAPGAKDTVGDCHPPGDHTDAETEARPHPQAQDPGYTSGRGPELRLPLAAASSGAQGPRGSNTADVGAASAQGSSCCGGHR